jgi:hypothetical protein
VRHEPHRSRSMRITAFSASYELIQSLYNFSLTIINKHSSTINYDMTLYFSEPENKKIFSNFVTKIEKIKNQKDDPSRMPYPAPQLISLFEFLLNNTENFDALCKSNIKWIGKSFLDKVSTFSIDKSGIDNTLLEIFVLAYRIGLS